MQKKEECRKKIGKKGIFALRIIFFNIIIHFNIKRLNRISFFSAKKNVMKIPFTAFIQ